MKEKRDKTAVKLNVVYEFFTDSKKRNIKSLSSANKKYTKVFCYFCIKWYYQAIVILPKHNNTATPLKNSF